MNKKFACHYSIARFCPYPETDEFANVGVVLACPTLGYFDGLRVDLRKRGRVGRFFPELDPNIYRGAIFAFSDRIDQLRRLPIDGQLLTLAEQALLRESFLALVRPRESILYYSEPRVILSDDPVSTLNDVFGAYVERRFAQVTEYQERVMVQRLEVVLREANLLSRYHLNEQVGDERYHVTFPFVQRLEGDPRPRQAIKALHLDREEPSDIFKHADAWRGHVRRLKSFDTAPADLLFVLRGPQPDRSAHRAAFNQVRGELDEAGIPHVEADAEDKIVSYASKVVQ